ncbi:hypothetical protein HYY74_02695 [Candidatus Woesearchaeota archaeon]|nr:hypothetical protein [Candidatus Woesearchaeota archaeon]
MEIQVKAKKWGDSIGIIIPKRVADEAKIKPDESRPEQIFWDPKNRQDGPGAKG